MKTWIVLFLLAWASVGYANPDAPTGAVWNDAAPASQAFLAAVTAFTEEPTEATYTAATNTWAELYTAWKAIAQEYDADPHQRNWTQWFASVRIAEDDLESLITASRCPVPFTKHMIRMLSTDMQGIHTSRHLLSNHPQGLDGSAAMVNLFRDQPRRCAYLRSITEMLVEKIEQLHQQS